MSVASAWEIVLKHRQGKLLVRTALEQFLDQILYRSPSTMLPISSQHLPVLAALPSIHKDPFDRMLVAQAIVEGFTLLTSDPTLAKYPGSIRLV